MQLTWIVSRKISVLMRIIVEIFTFRKIYDRPLDSLMFASVLFDLKMIIKLGEERMT